MKLIGPFAQLLTMDHLPSKGSIADDQLEIIPNSGLVVDDGLVVETGDYLNLEKKAIQLGYEFEKLIGEMVAIPGLIDAHTHICWAGSRGDDYAKRLSGKTYLEIAAEGGGIWNTVQKTRAASLEELIAITQNRANEMLFNGITTIEVKSGYGLSVEVELKILKAIKAAETKADLIATCLAAHIRPNDFDGWNLVYLEKIIHELLPLVKAQKLSNRVDIFVEESAFSINEAGIYLQEAKALGFDLVIHGDQFTLGGSRLAIELGAVSVDHLEVSDQDSILKIAKSNVVAVVLPGASIGLGLPFAPARKLLDAGACVAIASDWNPGSAPMGDLLCQAAIIGSYEKLTITETLAAITVRAAKALKMDDRGVLKPGNIADIVAFKTNNYRDIVYRQGNLKPVQVWKRGTPIRPR